MFTPEQQQQQHEIQWKTEKPFWIIPTKDPDGPDPNHFMAWIHPFTSVISGPTGSGNYVFVKRFVENMVYMMSPIPDLILWCYGEYQPLYEIIRGVEFRAGLPNWDTLDPEQRNLIIIEDLIDETDQRVASLFTKKSHHRNISVMYIVQNLFHKGKISQNHKSQCPLRWFYSKTRDTYHRFTV